MQWNAYILAGGASSRMGQDKSLLPLDGRSLLEHALALLSPRAKKLALAGDHPHLSRYGRVVRDLHPGCGPLGGIHAALTDSDTEWNLIYAVDQLWQDARVIDLLATQANLAQPDCLIVAPRLNHRPQPLCAFYRKPFAALADAAISQHDYKIGLLFEPAHALLLTGHDFSRVGIDPTFLNLNTPADYSAALQQWEASKR